MTWIQEGRGSYLLDPPVGGLTENDEMEMWSCELVLYWGRRRVISDEGISDHNSTATCTHEVKYEPCCEEMKWQHERGPCRNAEDSNPTEGTNAPEGVIA
jgi:hypothetical protein